MENYSQSPLRQSLSTLFTSALNHRGVLFSVILIVALAGFEMFNFSTTQFALDDLLGDMRFGGVRWATILAIAFCGIDFAGIARLFTPGSDHTPSKEAWYLFAAWLLAATMNAILTWWGVSMALANHTVNSTFIVDPAILSRGVPVFVAGVVWVTRFLLISMLANAAAGLTSPERPRVSQRRSQPQEQKPRLTPQTFPNPRPVSAASVRAQQPQVAASRPRPSASNPPRPLMSPPVHPPAPKIAAPVERSSQPAVERSAPQRTFEPASPQNSPQRAVATPRPAPAAAPNPIRKPAATPPARPRPAMPTTPPPPEEPTLPEPEYIPDPFYSHSAPAYHSLSARADVPTPELTDPNEDGYTRPQSRPKSFY